MPSADVGSSGDQRQGGEVINAKGAMPRKQSCVVKGPQPTSTLASLRRSSLRGEDGAGLQGF